MNTFLAGSTQQPPSPAGHMHYTGKATLGSAFIYAVNHTLACTFYDIPVPFIAAAFSSGYDRMRGKSASQPWWKKVKDSHHHVHHDHDHQHDEPATFHSAFWDRSKHWIKGEMAGDFGAILPTLAIQHYAPWLMDGLRKGLEPVFGPVFRRSCHRAAKQQAAAFGVKANQEVINARANALYEHEMAHLPLAFIWTPLSATINVTLQKMVLQDRLSWGNLILSKAVASVMSAGTVFSVRSLAPTHVQKFEAGLNTNVLTPAAQWAGKLAGMDKETIRHALDNSETAEAWAERIRSMNPTRQLVPG